MGGREDWDTHQKADQQQPDRHLLCSRIYLTPTPCSRIYLEVESTLTLSRTLPRPPVYSPPVSLKIHSAVGLTQHSSIFCALNSVADSLTQFHNREYEGGVRGSASDWQLLTSRVKWKKTLIYQCLRKRRDESVNDIPSAVISLLLFQYYRVYSIQCTCVWLGSVFCTCVLPVLKC